MSEGALLERLKQCGLLNFSFLASTGGLFDPFKKSVLLKDFLLLLSVLVEGLLDRDAA